MVGDMPIGFENIEIISALDKSSFYQNYGDRKSTHLVRLAKECIWIKLYALSIMRIKSIIRSWHPVHYFSGDI